MVTQIFEDDNSTSDEDDSNDCCSPNVPKKLKLQCPDDGRNVNQIKIHSFRTINDRRNKKNIF